MLLYNPLYVAIHSDCLLIIAVSDYIILQKCGAKHEFLSVSSIKHNATLDFSIAVVILRKIFQIGLGRDVKDAVPPHAKSYVLKGRGVHFKDGRTAQS